MLKLTLCLAVPLLLLACQTVQAQSIDLGNGFSDHGVATPVSNHRGIVATVDGAGKPVALVWLFDHTGGYALLMLDCTTGEAQQFPMPFKTGDCPFASILSSQNRFYTHFGNWFCEFDPAVPGFTFHHQTVPQMAMSMTEDDDGRIWSATYPQSGVACYNPKTGEFRDYGHVYKQNWRQYPRSSAADDTGWIYFGTGSTAGQIIMLDPVSGTATPVIPDDQRAHGAPTVTRDLNGKVYGRANDRWYELYRGQATLLAEAPTIKAKPIITGSQSLYHRAFPGGGRLDEVNLVDRQLVATDAAGEKRTFAFDYTSEGAHLMGVAAASNGTLCGGTAFPMRFFSYDPKADTWVNRAAYGQWNTVAPTETVFFVGGYGHGYLLEWDPSAEWVPTVKGQEGCNPQFLIDTAPTINRPHSLLAHPDGRHVILAGTPGYGHTGGGLLIWDREQKQGTLLTHEDLILQQSTMALVALPDGNVLGGTTISAGTGGEVKATLAELYLLDLPSRKVVWHEAVLPGVKQYTDLMLAPDGKVFGFADQTRFFVFDPATRTVVHEASIAEDFRQTIYQQGPRVFVPDDAGTIYVLFTKGIAKLDPTTYEFTLLAESPVPPAGGGAWLDGRIYFFRGSHLYSWQVPAEAN